MVNSKTAVLPRRTIFIAQTQEKRSTFVSKHIEKTLTWCWEIWHFSVIKKKITLHKQSIIMSFSYKKNFYMSFLGHHGLKKVKMYWSFNFSPRTWRLLLSLDYFISASPPFLWFLGLTSCTASLTPWMERASWVRRWRIWLLCDASFPPLSNKPFPLAIAKADTCKETRRLSTKASSSPQCANLGCQYFSIINFPSDNNQGRGGCPK